MTDWQVLFLGITALALVAMAAAQVVIGVAALRASRQVTEALQDMRREVRPLIDKANRITDDAVRVTALAVAQVERVDRLITSVSVRVEETVGIVQGAVIEPVRQGAAMVAAFRAVLAGFREWQARSGTAREDEDPLFVG